jgi:hypothetical protein
MRTDKKSVVVGIVCSSMYVGIVWAQQLPGGAPGAEGVVQRPPVTHGMKSGGPAPAKNGLPMHQPAQQLNVPGGVGAQIPPSGGTMPSAGQLTGGSSQKVEGAVQQDMRSVPPVSFTGMPGIGPKAPVSGVTLLPAQQNPVGNEPENSIQPVADQSAVPSTNQVTEQVQQQQEEEPRPHEEPVHISQDRPVEGGIDTLEIDEQGGNWLVKRMWWEKAEEKIGKIETSIETINNSRTSFYDKRDQLDAQIFDPFYAAAGLDQGQLEDIINYLLGELQQKREKETALDRESLEFRKKIEAEKQVLEDLKNDVIAIHKLDGSLDEALDKLVEQINLTKKYRKEAQQFFKDIANVLDHEKAREYYYRLDAAWQNIKGIQEYITGKFTEYFEQLGKNAHDQVARIKTVMSDLEKRGLSLKDQFNQRKTAEQRKAEERLRAQKLADEQAAANVGFLTKVWRAVVVPFQAVWSWLKSFGNWIASFWGGGEVVDSEKSEQKQEAAPGHPAAQPGVPAQQQQKTPVVPQQVTQPESYHQGVTPQRVETRRMMGDGVPGQQSGPIDGKPVPAAAPFERERSSAAVPAS